MIRKSSHCAVCENLNLASICAICVNLRLSEYYVSQKSLKKHRDSLYLRLSRLLEAKAKADKQLNWRELQNEKLGNLKAKLGLSNEKLLQDKAKAEEISLDLKGKYELLEAAMSMLERKRIEQLERFYPNFICTQSLDHMAITAELLHKQSVIMKQICKLFPQCQVNNTEERNDSYSSRYDQICGACLPRGLDPHSVSADDLSASLGYMVQLLNIIVQNLAAPSLHNSGFAGSCSRIWQRDSYWDASPPSRSNEYPLFLPRQNYSSTTGENSWSDRNSSNFGVASMESASSRFSYSSASFHSVESRKDLQKGISLLKKSVACITAYVYNSLCIDFPAEASTFEVLSKLLSILSSSKGVRSVFSSKMASSRPSKQVQQLNGSVWNVNSVISSSTLMDSLHSVPAMKNVYDHHFVSSTATYLGSGEVIENLMEGWDIVEHPTLPPPPSQNEDVEHWTRAMFVDTTEQY